LFEAERERTITAAGAGDMLMLWTIQPASVDVTLLFSLAENA
jgi:hypothetical protein